jgi:hypothetical protein
MSAIALLMLFGCNDDSDARFEQRLEAIESQVDALATQTEPEVVVPDGLNAMSYQHDLGGGIALNYELADGSHGVLNYPVDDVLIFSTFDDLPSFWKRDSDDAPNAAVNVRLAWVVRADNPVWELHYADRVLDEQSELKLSNVSLNGWQEYLLMGDVSVGDDGIVTDDSTAVLHVEQSDNQPITPVLLEVLDPSLPENIFLLQLDPAILGEEQTVVQMLLTFSSDGGQSENVLVIIWDSLALAAGDTPGQPPAGGDSLARRQCSRCYFGFCRLSCRYWRR